MRSTTPAQPAFLALALAFTAAGCASTDAAKNASDKPAEATPSAGATKKDGDEAGKAAQLAHAVAIAELRLEQIKVQQTAEVAVKERELDNARTDLELARGKLASFDAIEAPNRLAQSKLDLKRVRDSAKEAADELVQIEQMYDQEQIDDRTKEFVVERGRRNAENRAAQIAIQERNLELLEKHELPRDRARHALEVARKESDTQRLVRAMESDRLEREIKLLNATHELEKARRELAAAESK
jgi:HlyD family secretion protein